MIVQGSYSRRADWHHFDQTWEYQPLPNASCG